MGCVWEAPGEEGAREGGEPPAPLPPEQPKPPAPGHGREWDLYVKKAWGGMGMEGRRGSRGIAIADGMCHAQVTYHRWELQAKWESKNTLKIPLPLTSTLADT